MASHGAVSAESPSPEYLAQYHGQRLIVAATIFLVINVTFVGLRFYARRLQRQKLNWDDWILIPAFIAILGSIIIAYLSLQYGGVGRHVEYVAHHRDIFIYYYKICIIALPFIYLCSAVLPKFSILGLYLHILRDKPSRWIVYGLMFIIVANFIIMTALVANNCNPISYGWRSKLGEKVPGAWCVNVQPRFVWGTFANILTDVVMIVLPIPLLWRIQMNRAHKLGLSIMFGLGGIGIIASCMRFAAFYSTEVFKDATWAAVELVAWCIVEPSIYLMAACMLSYGPLATRIYDRVAAAMSKISGGSSSGSSGSRSRGRGNSSGHGTPQEQRRWTEKSSQQQQQQQQPGQGQSHVYFTPTKSLFSTEISTTQISTFEVGSGSLADTLTDYTGSFPKNVIHIKRSFDVESYAMESPHEQSPNASESDVTYGIAF